MIVTKVSPTSKRVVFSDFGDFITTMEAEGKRHQRHNYGGATWAGAASLSDAVVICKDGWDGGRKVVEPIVASLQSSLKQVARDIAPLMQYDVAGAYPDMGRFMEGEPECMVQFMPNPDQTSGQVCRVLIDCGANAHYTSEWMTKRAGAVTALVQVLTMVGKSVEIWIASPVDIGSKRHDTLVCVNNAGSVLNADDIAFALGHPAMLRQMIFACREHAEMGWDDSGVGSSVPHDSATLEYLKPELVVHRAEHCKKGTPDPAHEPLEWVKYMLKDMGLLSE